MRVEGCQNPVGVMKVKLTIVNVVPWGNLAVPGGMDLR